MVATRALREEAAIQELTEYLGSIYVLWKQRSLVIVSTRKDPYEAIEIIRKDIDPNFTSILKIIPIDDIVPPYVDKVADKVKSLALSRIGKDETFRITLQGRLYRLEGGIVRKVSSMDAIRIIAEGIDRKVNLEHPDKVVYIRTIRVKGEDYASITICPPDKILSTQKLVQS